MNNQCWSIYQSNVLCLLNGYSDRRDVWVYHPTGFHYARVGSNWVRVYWDSANCIFKDS